MFACWNALSTYLLSVSAPFIVDVRLTVEFRNAYYRCDDAGNDGWSATYSTESTNDVSASSGLNFLNYESFTPRYLANLISDLNSVIVCLTSFGLCFQAAFVPEQQQHQQQQQMQ